MKYLMALKPLVFVIIAVKVFYICITQPCQHPILGHIAGFAIFLGTVMFSVAEMYRIIKGLPFGLKAGE